MPETLTEDGVTASAHRCKHCGGHFFDRDAFEAISEVPSDERPDLSRIPDANAQLRPMPCPSCGPSETMVKAQARRDRDVTMDLCASCWGIWLDAGELEAIRGHEVSFANQVREWWKNL
jgi:Zn-finger nucleic acid-binding protein